jgi:hypothetical protein
LSSFSGWFFNFRSEKKQNSAHTIETQKWYVPNPTPIILFSDLPTPNRGIAIVAPLLGAPISKIVSR